MKNWLLPLLLVCVALAALKVVLIGLVVALVLALVYASIARPGETLLFLVVLTLFTAASAQPVLFITTLGIVVLAAVAAEGRRKAPKQQAKSDCEIKRLR